MDVIQQATAVALVLLLLGGTLWCLRRRGIASFGISGRSRRRRMDCLERLPLGPHHALHLVRCDGAELVIASSPGGCSLLFRSPARPEEVTR